MNDQDHKFVDKVKAHLKKKGDIVKVSDIHPGEWSSVCATELGAYGSVTNDVFLRWEIEDVEYLNEGEYWFRNTGYGDKYWGIYFFYPPNKVEYYRIFVKEAAHVKEAKSTFSGCVEKEKAYFSVSGDFKNRKYVGMSTDVEQDFLEMTIIKENK